MVEGQQWGDSIDRRASADSNGGPRPYFREITASPNLTAATAAIAAILPAARLILAQ